jgi:hypothetical protein
MAWGALGTQAALPGYGEISRPLVNQSPGASVFAVTVPDGWRRPEGNRY